MREEQRVDTSHVGNSQGSKRTRAVLCGLRNIGSWAVAMPMAFGLRTWLDLRTFAESAHKPAAIEIERALQIASGALFVALVSVLGAIWGPPTEPRFLLRQAIVGFLPYIGISLGLAVGATYARVVSRGDASGAVVWVGAVFAAYVCLATGGVYFFMSVRDATNRDAAAWSRQADQLSHQTN